MTLIEQVNGDTISAMKSQDKFLLSVMRMLKSSLQMEKIKAGHDLSDQEVISVIKKQVKIRKDSIAEYTNYGRLDLTEDLKKEVDILAKYLPEELSKEEIENILEIVFQEVNPTGKQDMGLIMRSASSKLQGKADMKLVNEIVRVKLDNLKD